MTHVRRAAVIGLVLAVGLGLKLHYSAAGADELAYVLWPTTWLVELLTGATFVREAGAGYLSQELSILIAPSCAGVNFLVMAWCMLAATRAKLAWLPLSAGLAYAATVIVNAARIVTGATWSGAAVDLTGLPPGEIHRMLGVVVYLSALMLLYVATTAAQRRWAK